MTYQQHPPYTVKVELSEGCNLACSFCGINGIREKPGSLFLFMSVDTAHKIAVQLSELVTHHRWNPHIEFTMHGEPTMNPNFVNIIRIFRLHLPKTQLMLTSNGGGLLRGDTVDTLNTLFCDAGLNILALDDYDGVKIVGKIRQRVAEHPLGLDPSIQWYEYPEQREGNPHTRRPITTRMVTVIADLKHNAAEKKGVHSNIANHCGAGGPRDPSTMGRRCARPFRELAIRHNGNVAACCDDWRGEYNVGSVLEIPIGELWQNAEMQALRRKLYHGLRDFGPCLGCTSKSYRVGLLPDPQGKDTLPLPTEEDIKVIYNATRKPYATVIIQRPWEKDDHRNSHDASISGENVRSYT